MDRVDTETRSRVMASVRSKGSRSTEQRFQSLLEEAFIKGWRANPDGVRGNPDFVFDDAKVAIFIDGCFWHGCQTHCRMPANNADYWVKKIDRNISRDKEVNKLARQAGWKVLRFWEHAVKDKPNLVIKKLWHTLKRRNPESNKALLLTSSRNA